jgi:hypothetical protein
VTLTHLAQGQPIVLCPWASAPHQTQCTDCPGPTLSTPPTGVPDRTFFGHADLAGKLVFLLHVLKNAADPTPLLGSPSDTLLPSQKSPTPPRACC